MGSHQPRAAFWDGKCDSRDIFCGGFDDAETRYFAVLGLCLWMGRLLDGHLISRLWASAYSAPNFPFGKVRCCGRLIFRTQSTGLFSPKRSTSRAAPLRRAPASLSAPKQSFGLFRCSAWLILRKQSTGLFPPKRSCFRASPLRVNPQGEALGWIPQLSAWVIQQARPARGAGAA